MNTITKTDSYAQFMKLIASARARNSQAVAKTTPAAIPQARPETRMMPLVMPAGQAQPKGRILGNYFDAYA